MSDHTWRAANDGVFLWEPAREAVITQNAEELPEPEQRDYAGSYHCEEQEQVLPSIEDVFVLPRMKPEFIHNSLMFESPSSSLSFSNIQNSTPIATSRCSTPASEILLKNGLYEQLKEFAITPVREESGVPKILFKEQSKSSANESSSIDVQLTPCPTRLSLKKVGRNLLESDKESHHSDRGAKANTSRRVRRMLNFKIKKPSLYLAPEPCSSDSQTVQREMLFRTGGSDSHSPPTLSSKEFQPVQERSISKTRSPSHRSTTTPRAKELSNLESLEALRNIERPPSHLWDADERALLTILYRWYDSIDIWIIPQVFNKITGLNLQRRSIYYQFKSHILLFGGRAYPEFARVMAVPFHDPEGIYEDMHQIIEEAAADLGVELPRRETEEKFVSGMARYAKSPRTRQTYRSLVRRAAKMEKEKARIARMRMTNQCVVSQQSLPISKQLLGHKALVLGAEDKLEECWIDVEDLSTQASPELTKRTIAFRVWDNESWSKFSEETGFVSQAFTKWCGEYLPPFSPEGQGLQAIKLLTNLHLCPNGGASTFVSLSTSLLQALVKASRMDNPRIAVVALDHPLLTAPNKTIPAADCLKMLKAEGQAPWAVRYKGQAEQMVWASVPASTILCHFPISDLCDLAEKDEVCAQILNLHAFHRGGGTGGVSDAMRERRNTITPATARAMGAIARTFGMHRDKVGLEHIQGLVAALVDSFQLAQDSRDLAHAEHDMAYAFAVKLRSRAHHVKDVAHAFRDGVRKGREIVGYYESRRQCNGGKGRKD